MSYVKNTWQTGDVITASKMNNIENGIEAASQGGGGGGGLPSIDQYGYDKGKSLVVVESLDPQTYESTYKAAWESLIPSFQYANNGDALTVYKQAVSGTSGQDQSYLQWTQIIPPVTYSSDPYASTPDGSFLMYYQGSVAWVPMFPIPEYGDPSPAVLVVTGTSGSPVFDWIPFPTFDSASDGDVLTIVNGTPTWVTPSN